MKRVKVNSCLNFQLMQPKTPDPPRQWTLKEKEKVITLFWGERESVGRHWLSIWGRWKPFPAGKGSGKGQAASLWQGERSRKTLLNLCGHWGYQGPLGKKSPILSIFFRIKLLFLSVWIRSPQILGLMASGPVKNPHGSYSLLVT